MQYRMPILGLLAATLAAGGCAPMFNNSGAEAMRAPAAANGEVLVRVRNHNWADMTVYVVRNGTRARLGTVTSMTESVFPVPRGFGMAHADVQLLADPIGSNHGYRTDLILVSPGQTIDLTLENNINLSNYAVW